MVLLLFCCYYIWQRFLGWWNLCFKCIFDPLAFPLLASGSVALHPRMTQWGYPLCAFPLTPPVTSYSTPGPVLTPPEWCLCDPGGNGNSFFCVFFQPFLFGKFAFLFVFFCVFGGFPGDFWIFVGNFLTRKKSSIWPQFSPEIKNFVSFFGIFAF